MIQETTPGETAQRAELIVVGSVSQVASRWNGEHNLIFTDATISVENTLKGAAASQIVVTVLGGEVDGITLSANGGTFTVGEQLLLFLAQGDGAFVILDGGRGRYTVENGKIAGASLSPTQFLESIQSSSSQSLFTETTAYEKR